MNDSLLTALSALSLETLKFAKPTAALWFLVPALLAVIALVSGKRSLISVFLRTITLSVLVLALMQPAIEQRQEQRQYAALLDLSASIPDRAVRAFIEQLKPFVVDRETTVNILPYGAKAGAESVQLSASSDLTVLAKTLTDSRESVNPSETNTGAGLKKLLGSADVTSVLLMSDGFDTGADARQVARMSAGKGIPIFSILAPEALFRTSHVSISSVHAPITSGAGDKVEVRVSVKNSFAQNQERVLELWLGNERLTEKRIDVPAGEEQLIVVETPALVGGLQRLRAVLITDGASATDLATVERHRWISVKEKAKLLLISGSNDDQRVLRDLIRVKGFGVETIVADGNQEVPTNFTAYSSVILNNTSFDQLPKAFLPNVEAFVKDGGGLLLVGGDRSFGLGRYIDTPLERMSPLKFLPPQTEKRRLKVGLILVMDKSGSMAQEGRLAAAKQAAMLSLDALNPEDFISVIGFDDNPFEVFSIRTVEEARALAERRMASMAANGATNLLPALALARQRLKSVDAGRKHVIVLSDGRFPVGSDVYAEEINRLRGEKITVSAVALGVDADVPFMKFLAQAGRGAFYQTVDPSRLPKIFVEDIKVTSGERTLSENSTFPVGAGPGGVVSTTLDRFPPVLGFVETLPKKGSTLELITRKEDQIFPLMASWLYGSGTVVAFTSDANGRWSDPWVRWPEFARFWGQVIENVRNRSSNDANQIDFDLRYTINRQSLGFELSVFDPKLQSQAAPQITAQVLDPAGEPKEISFRPVQKGRFGGRIENARAGDYKLDIKYGNLSFPPVAITIPGEAFGEVLGKGLNISYLEELSYLSGGSVNPAPVQVEGKVNASTTREELFVPLLFLAFGLILIEAFLRELLPAPATEKRNQAA